MLFVHPMNTSENPKTQGEVRLNIPAGEVDLNNRLETTTDLNHLLNTELGQKLFSTQNPEAMKILRVILSEAEKEANSTANQDLID
jgi:hypothetical protein